MRVNASSPCEDASEVARGALRLVPTRANTQPAFACYLRAPDGRRARPYAMFVLTLDGDRISANHLVRRPQRVPSLRIAA